MPEDREAELSPGSLAILKALIAASSEEAPLTIDARALARTACGFATPDEQETVLTALTESEPMRDRLLAMRDSARAFSQAPIAGARPNSEDEQAVAEVLRERLQGNTAAYGRLRDWWNRNDWQAAMAARSAVRAVADSVRLMLSQPSFATARSSALADSTTSILASNLTAELEVTFRGRDLIAHASLGGSPESYQGQRLFLEVVDPAGGAVPIAAAPVDGRNWTAEVESFAETVEPASLYFRLALGEESNGNPSRLFASVQGSSAVVELALASVPRISQEVLTLEVSVPAEARALYAGRMLVLSMSLGNLAQVIGSWNVNDWKSDPRPLEIPLANAPDGPLACTSVIKAQIR